MIALGTTMSADEALACGLIDELAVGDPLAAALQLARRVAGQPPRRTRDLAPAATEASVFADFPGEECPQVSGPHRAECDHRGD